MPAEHARLEPLEAILLVGGYGTRLRPLTLASPKHLLPTAGVPFLTHQFAKAAQAGITHVVLATSYRAEMFAERFGDGSELGLEITYVHEEEPLGTGGAIRNAARGLRGGPDDPVVIFNGDVLSGHDIAAQLDMHSKADAAVTLHLVEVPDPARFGCVPLDPAGRVTAFLEKTPNPVTNRINAGCYVFRRSVIDEIPPNRVVSVERETFPAFIARGQVLMGFVDTAYWLVVGTPETFVQGSCDVVLGRLASPALPAPRRSAGARSAVVAPDARLSGGTVVGAGAVVGNGARVEGSVLFDDGRIAAGASVRDSAIGKGARIGAGVVIDAAVIGDGAVIAEGNELRAGARVWPGVTLGPTSVRFSTDV
jgi:mannose-1-phosphate guanylyltransferase